LDRVSQYIVSEVIEKGSQEPIEVVFRIVLFNMFTKIETYELLEGQLGPLTWATYNRQAYKNVLDEAKDDGIKLYTGAFQKPLPKLGHKGYVNHLELLELLMQDLPGQLSGAEYLVDVFEYVVSFPGMSNFISGVSELIMHNHAGMGDFSAYQLLLNLTYSNVINFSESDFVVAGPGALSGLSKLFGDSMARAIQAVPGIQVDVMRWLQVTQNEHFKRLGLYFSGLGPDRLPMQLCDIEHTLCEVDKYARVAHPNIRGLHGRTHLRGASFRPSSTFSPDIHIPKAWSHPDRKKVRIKPGGPFKVRKRYVISRIIDHRNNEMGHMEFKVRWWGYSDEDDTWEPEDELREDAPGAVETYLASIG